MIKKENIKFDRVPNKIHIDVIKENDCIYTVVKHPYNISFLEYMFKYNKLLIKFNRDSVFTFIEEDETCIDYAKDDIICWEQINGGTPKESFLLLEGVSVPEYAIEDYVKGFRYFTYKNYKFVDLKSDIKSKRNKLLKEIEKLDLRYGLALDF